MQPGSNATECHFRLLICPQGRRVGSFANAHDSARLTAATFDAQQRRLVTGGSDGSVHIWSAVTKPKPKPKPYLSYPEY